LSPFGSDFGVIGTVLAILLGLFLAGVAIMVLIVSVRFVAVAVGRIIACAGGIVGDLITAVVNLAVAPFSLARALVLLVIGRFREADRSAERFQSRIVEVGMRLWSAVVQRPLRIAGVRVPPRRHSLVPAHGPVGPGAPPPPPLMAHRGAATAPPPFAASPRSTVDPPPWPNPAGFSNSFPGYEIEGRLPSGGSGARLFVAAPEPAKQVLLPGTPSRVVIKSFAIGEGSTLPQIIRESRSLDAAKSLGLVLDHALEPHRFWYAMPHFVGPTLTELVGQRHRALGSSRGLDSRSLRELVSLMADVVENLAKFHRGGLWHKDVKPDNIIVSAGRAHLIDVGLVTPLASTFTLTTHGTEYFRDPEMVRQALRGTKVHQVDGARFDIYSAGAVLYSVLENTFPAHGALSRFERPSPESLRWIVRRAMADYHRRYPTMDEMLADLRFVLMAKSPDAALPAQLPSMRGADPASMLEPRLELNSIAGAAPRAAAGAVRDRDAGGPVRRFASRWCGWGGRSAQTKGACWKSTMWSPWATAAVAVVAIAVGILKSDRGSRSHERNSSGNRAVVHAPAAGESTSRATRRRAESTDLPEGSGPVLVERSLMLSNTIPESAESAAMVAIGKKGWTPIVDDAEALAALATLAGREPEAIQAELARRGYRGLVRLEPRGERVHVRPVSFIAR